MSREQSSRHQSEQDQCKSLKELLNEKHQAEKALRDIEKQHGEDKTKK